MSGRRAPPPGIVQSRIARASAHIAGLDAPTQAPAFHPFPGVANCRFEEHNVTTALRLPAAPRRVYLFILNTSAAIIYVSFGGGTASATVGLPILAATATALGFYEPAIAPINTISVAGSCYLVQGILT